MSMLSRSFATSLLVWGCLQLTGCGDSPGTYDPVQSDLNVIKSDANIEVRRRSAASLSGQYLSDEQIDQMMAIVLDSNQDNVIRARLIWALGGVEPDRSDRFLPKLAELSNQVPPGSEIQKAILRVIKRLGGKNQE